MLIQPAHARKLLAAVRLVNGGAAVLAPAFLLRRLGTDPTLDRSGFYPFRMFGVRTVLLGADLLVLHGEELRRARQRAVVIHSSDTVCAAIAWRRGDLPKRQAIAATAISGVNTVLAVAALAEHSC